MSAVPEWVRAQLRPGEEVVWWARPSLVGLVPILASTLFGVAFVVVTSTYGYQQPSVLSLTGTPALLVALGGVLLESARRFVKLRFTTYVITRERFYAITSFLETNARGVPLARMTSVALRQGLAGRLFGFWSATLGVYGEGRGVVQVLAIRDGEGLLREASEGQRRGANAAWLLRGD